MGGTQDERQTLSLAIPQGETRPDSRLPDAIAYGAIAVLGLLLWWADRYHAASVPAWAPYDFDWTYYLAAALGAWWYARGLALQAPGKSGRRSGASRSISSALR